MSKKIGIVLSGGGAKGAFEVGVLKVILEKIKKDGDVLHSVSGSSIGAMNGAFVVAGQFNDLESIWLSWDRTNCPLSQTDIFGPMVTMLYRGYMYHADPLKAFLKKSLLVPQLLTSSVKYINNSIRLGDQKLRFGGNIFGNKDQDLAIAEIMASMAFVPGMPSVTIGGEEYADGGFRDALPVKTLIEKSDKLDRIYVISVSPEESPWNAGLIKNDITSLIPKLNFVYGGALWPEANRSDIEIGKLMFTGDAKEYITVYPEFAKMEAADFDKVLIKEAYQHGIDIAKKIQ